MLAKPTGIGGTAAVIGSSAGIMRFTEDRFLDRKPNLMGVDQASFGFPTAIPNSGVFLPAPKISDSSLISGIGLTALVAKSYLAQPVIHEIPKQASSVELTSPQTVTIAGRQFAITPEALQALQTAKASKHYEVRLAAKNNGEKESLIVMLGESHVKSAQAYALGDAITDHFDFRGLEGADTDKTWGGRFFNMFISLSHFLAPLFVRGNKGSTIGEAALDDFGPQLQLAFKEVLSHVAKEEKLSEKSAEELAAFHYPIKISQGKAEKIYDFTGTQILEIVGGQRDAITQRVKNIHLEAGHVPDLFEHAASIYLPASIALWATYLAVEFGETYVPALEPVADVLAIPFWGLVIFSWGSLIGRKVLKPAPNSPLQFLTDATYGLISGRNKTMVANTIKALEENPDQAVILDIVGSAHIPGMMDLFIEKYGFEEISLPESPQ